MSPQNGGEPRFREAVESFADAVARRFAAPVDAQPEAQLTEPVRDLLRACGEPWNLTVDPYEQVKVRGVGWPDLGVTVGGLLCGYVELKAPDVGARPENFGDANREQWKRYRALPNLIYTDGAEWSLYRKGERAARVRIADDVRDGLRASRIENVENHLLVGLASLTFLFTGSKNRARALDDSGPVSSSRRPRDHHLLLENGVPNFRLR